MQTKENKKVELYVLLNLASSVWQQEEESTHGRPVGEKKELFMSKLKRVHPNVFPAERIGSQV